MKKLFPVLMVILSLSLSSYGQKAKFDSETIKVSKVHLSQRYFEPEDRTYRIVITGAYRKYVPNEYRLGGFEYLSQNPNLKVLITLNNFNVTKPVLKKNKKEEKNRDGKVTKSWTEYWIETGVEMKGLVSAQVIKSPSYLGKDEAAEQKTEEKKEVTADSEDNPFLTEEDKAEAAANAEAEAAENEANYHTEWSYSRTMTEERKTGVFRSSKAAYDDYNNRLRFELEGLQEVLAKKLYKQLATDANYQFAYKPYSEQFNMKKIKNDDHPEAKQWNQAVEASKVLFENVSYDQPIDDTRTKFEPIIKYFESVADKYSVDDRKEAKVKDAALINLYYILYNLDQHIELMTQAKKYLDIKKIGRHAKKHLLRSEKQMELLTFHQMNSAHLDKSSGESDVELDVVEDEDDDLDEDE